MERRTRRRARPPQKRPSTAGPPQASPGRRLALVSGNVLIVLGLAVMAWGAVTWQWGDPVTALHTKRAQERLAEELDRRRSLGSGEGPLAAQPAEAPRTSKARSAQQFRAELREGDAVGRLVVPRLDLGVIVVFGTRDTTLRDGPGLHRSTRLPGQGSLVYVAGHRTTYGAPFAHLDRLRAGDVVTFETTYGAFGYRVTDVRVVDDTDLSVLRPTKTEVLRLQACHPRFRATERLVVSARLVSLPA